MSFYLWNERKQQVKEYDNRAEAEEQRDKLIELGMNASDVELTPEHPMDDPTIDTGEAKSDGGETDAQETQEPEVVDTTETVDVDTDTSHDIINDPEKLSQDPIGWLEDINNSFVNRIRGTPAISKKGFRFIQSQFGITTEAEVVQWIDDPTGVIIWAKAELPDGQSAEAHGEGYLSESKVDDNEFVRYADSRAKNRAISDLTSAGALAVSELTEEQ